MSKVLFSLFFVGTSAFAAPIFCGSKSSAYRVVVSNDNRSAKLEHNGKVTEFGKLECRYAKQLVCSSPHVADAGYQATFTRKPRSNDLLVKVDEIWFGGTRPLVTLPCVAALNHN